jgi:NDP-sugar pyrophosphorylase family protein
MKLLVLAGGFGTRLKSAVADVPKALAPIGEVPFLEFQLENWLKQGFREFTFLLHHQADQTINFLQAQMKGKLKGCQVDWLIEPKPLDTGGAIAHAVKEFSLNNDFLTTNADTWLGGGLRDLMQAASPAMAVVNLADVSRYGQVHFDQINCITEFAEKTNQISAGWINAGLCYLSADLFNDWNGEPFSLERDLFTKLVNKRHLTAVPLQTEFIDIGIPADYYRFCSWVEGGRQCPL